MGIQGLLPALKSIQTTKHLSEFAGQTVAVDAYVWLHKGVFTCATELATGKPTHKYVNYAMEKVRLLRYHGIEPYIVFDGGPLPAKKGTEVERKRKRDEQLSRGNLLAAQGKHPQARDCYLKAVDVTPQMAFQFIKALRAESVPYVVAPYEADAQLAYLERQGIVSAILTEDSDLLVFGCKNVLFKFDPVARTVISISRTDFASVTASSSDANVISLVGWSDNQFRAMAILSGCDYLSSIPGIGLKTANVMLRKWKTPQAVVQQVALEGKKRVPKGYLDQFKLAEKCFLHQRVYDPLKERLVYLTDVDLDSWDDAAEAYVGSDLEPTLAKKLAMGDVDPISLNPMLDINPEFRPRSRVLRDLPNPNSPTARTVKDKGKETKKPSTGGIFNFFGPNPIIPPRPRSPSRKMLIGKSSGKRTLAEVMDQETAAKKKIKVPSFAPTSPLLTSSKFFGAAGVPNIRRVSSSANLGSEADVSTFIDEKENLGYETEAEGLVDDGGSLVAQGYVDAEMEEDVQFADDAVEQEDGYLSPTPSMSKDEEFPSPVKSRNRRNSADAEFDFDVDPISSPANHTVQLLRLRKSHITTPVPFDTPAQVLIESSPEPHSIKQPVLKHEPIDLKDYYGNESSSEIDYCSSDDGTDARTPSLSPLTPNEPAHEDHLTMKKSADELEFDDPEENEYLTNAMRTRAVAEGWQSRWAHVSSRPMALKRRETNVTPTGRHRILPVTQNLPSSQLIPRSADSKVRGSSSKVALHSTVNLVRGRKSLTFEEVRTLSSVEATHPADPGGINTNIEDHEVLTHAQHRFERFRCP